MDDYFLENLSNLHLDDPKIKNTPLDSALCNDDNVPLESLLCDDTEPKMDKFMHCNNESFLENLKNVEILPSLTCILSDDNNFSIKQSTHNKLQTWDSKKQLKQIKNKSSLFFKALTAKVKIKKHQKVKLQQIKKLLHMHEHNSWYSVNLLIYLAKSNLR